MSAANCADDPLLLARWPQRLRNTPIGFFVDDRARTYGDEVDASAGGDTINDSESPNAKTAQPFKFVLERLARARVCENMFEGVADFALQTRMQVLDEAGDVRRDAELMNRALHARNTLPDTAARLLEKFIQRVELGLARLERTQTGLDLAH